MDECQCGHGKEIHFQDGCLSKAGGGYFCECMEFEPEASMSNANHHTPTRVVCTNGKTIKGTKQ